MPFLSCGKSTQPPPPPDLRDTIPPSPITHFSVDSASPSSISLSWLATGDDSSSGTAAVSEIRVSRIPLTDTTLSSGVLVAGPEPQPAGTRQTHTVQDLESSTDYYFALRSGDEVPNWSPYTFLGPVKTSRDTIPPAVVTDLHYVRGDSSSLTFWWTAPGDDGNQGRVARYDIRYSPETIDSQNFARARVAPTPINIFAAGVVQDITLLHLSQRTTYYVALRAYDDVGNASDLSNVSHNQTDRGFKVWRVAADGHGDTRTIQAGIDSARAGETVSVAPGIYHESIDFKGKGISVVSEQGYATTTIDATGTGKATVTFDTGEPEGTRIEGFTITGGANSKRGTDGGGISADHTSPTIVGNHIVGNGYGRVAGSRTGWGGGILINGQPYPFGARPVYTPTIEGNLIENNGAEANGGGIGAIGYIALRLVGNVIRGNVTDRGDGGGLWLYTQSDGSLIQDNEFSGNVAGDHGGGIYVIGHPDGSTTLLIERNSVFANVAQVKSGLADGGGGLWLVDTSALVQRNTFVGNAIAEGSTGLGSALSIWHGGAPRVLRNIIAYHDRGQLFYCGTGATPTFADNIFWSNGSESTEALCAALDTLVGYVLLDPLLCDPASGDLRLKIGSPALLYKGSSVGAYSVPTCPLP